MAEAMASPEVKQSQLAALVGVSSSTISRFIGDGATDDPKLEYVLAIAKALNFPAWKAVLIWADLPLSSLPMQGRIDQLTAELADCRADIAVLTAERDRLKARRDELAAQVAHLDHPLTTSVRMFVDAGHGVSVTRALEGPSEDVQVVSGYRMQIVLEHAVEGRTAKEVLAPLGEIMPRDAVWTSKTARSWFPLDRVLAGGSDQENDPEPEARVARLSVKEFERERPPAARPLPVGDGSICRIVVTGTTQESWTGTVAAVLARSMGWGFFNTTAEGRQVGEAVVGGAHTEQIQARAARRKIGLDEFLDNPWPSRVTALTPRIRRINNRPVGGDAHPVLSRAPFPADTYLVVLSQLDDELDEYLRALGPTAAGRQSSPTATDLRWVRDALDTAAEHASRQQRGTVVALPALTPGLSQVARRTVQWQRSLVAVRELRKTLLGDVPIDVADQDVRRLFEWTPNEGQDMDRPPHP